MRLPVTGFRRPGPGPFDDWHDLDPCRARADTLGAGGLIQSIAGGRISLPHAYPVIALVAAVVTWETDVYSLITLASRCFAFYNALQCMVAALSAERRGRRRRAGGFAALSLVCLAVVLLGTPAEGG